MKAANHISEELMGIAPVLAALGKKEFHQVPDGYFAESTEHILAVVEDRFIEVSLPPILASLLRVSIHPEVPADYFISLEGNVMAAINKADVVEELSYAAPSLLSAPKVNYHTVPADYFSSLPGTLVALAERETREHSADLEEKVSRWGAALETLWTALIKPSHAFVFTFTLTLAVVAGMVLSHSTLTPEEKIFAQMQQLPESEISQYMGKHRDDFDERAILQNINDIDFEHYFDKPENIPAHLKAIGAENQSLTEEDIID